MRIIPLPFAASTSRLTRTSIALIAFMVLPGSPLCAAPTVEQRAPGALRAVTFEAAPAALGNDRFRMSVRLHPSPVPAMASETGLLKLTLALVPKATAASCPSPGAIFSDGFESP